VNAWTVVNLLAYMAGSPMWESFWYTLPEAGARDGLHRMYKTAADGNLRAKTGTINRVSALSGYVKAANGERLAFSIISNNVPSTWKAKRIEDGIGARLAAFDRPPVTGDEEPAAATQPDPGPTEAVAPPPPPPATNAAPAPASTNGERKHVIRSGETLDGIAKQHGVTVDALQAANSGLNPRRLLPGEEIVVPTRSASDAPAAPSAKAATYTIRSGDTLDGIARRLGVTVAGLRAANPRLDPRRLLVGTTIRVR
jgi:LysM repeat protein